MKSDSTASLSEEHGLPHLPFVSYAFTSPFSPVFAAPLRFLEVAAGGWRTIVRIPEKG